MAHPDDKEEQPMYQKDDQNNDEVREEEEMLLSWGEQDENKEAEVLAERRRKRKRAILEKHAGKMQESSHRDQTKGDRASHSISDTIIKVHKDEELTDPSLKPNQLIEDFNGDKDDGNESDMFASESPEIIKKSNKDKDLFFQKSQENMTLNNVEKTADTANYDDSEGYFKATIGEIITIPSIASSSEGMSTSKVAVKYRILGTIGKGVFSSVVKCCNVDNPDHVVALKLIRNNEVMSKAAQKELRILKMLASSEPNSGKNHCIQILPGSGFEYHNHLCIYFEIMHLNLRETLHKFGKNVGIQLAAVRRYTRQLFLALEHLKSLSIVHADIKLDNILVNEDFSCLKLCDFGSAFFVSDISKEPTPYLVSRFYRAPEIILGLEYSHPVDMWSIAVTLAELFRGTVLFPGKSNNDMLNLFMETLGPFSNKMLKRHCLSYEKLGLIPHFDKETYAFRRHDVDFVTGRPVLRLRPITAARLDKSLSHIFLKSMSKSDERIELIKFADLLVRCLALDPARRITVEEALQHRFLKNQVKKSLDT